jgi:hypothetical protein
LSVFGLLAADDLGLGGLQIGFGLGGVGLGGVGFGLGRGQVRIGLHRDLGLLVQPVLQELQLFTQVVDLLLGLVGHLGHRLLDGLGLNRRRRGRREHDADGHAAEKIHLVTHLVRPLWFRIPDREGVRGSLTV